jgi:hypothetical protein
MPILDFTVVPTPVFTNTQQPHFPSLPGSRLPCSQEIWIIGHRWQPWPLFTKLYFLIFVLTGLAWTKGFLLVVGPYFSLKAIGKHQFILILWIFLTIPLLGTWSETQWKMMLQLPCSCVVSVTNMPHRGIDSSVANPVDIFVQIRKSLPLKSPSCHFLGNYLVNIQICNDFGCQWWPRVARGTVLGSPE